MYRGRLWTMRQFAGFGTAEETNERFRYLLAHGQDGLSTAFDMPSLMGYDSDHVLQRGRGRPRGRRRRHASTTWQTLFDGIDLGEISVSMTINAPAVVMLAFYVAAAEARGIPAERLRGTIQADILKEYIAQKEWCFPVDPAMRLCGDMIEWCTAQMPRWHPISVSGYHIREAGSTAAQELAFTIKDGLTYVEQAIERGLDVDDFAPRLSFFFNAQIDFFEEIAKYRAARRIWARELRERFGAKDPRSWRMRFHTQTAGVVADRPAAAEQRRPHGDRGARRRARRHAVAAHELLRRGARAADRGGRADRAAHAADHRPRDRRDEHDRPARRRVLRRGADRPARARGLRLLQPHRRARRHGRGRQANFPQREIADAAFALQCEYDSRERILVGVNDYVDAGDEEIPTLRIDPELERKQLGRLQAVRARRDGAAVERTLADAARAGRAASARTSCRRCWTARAPTPPRARSCARCRTSSGRTPRRRSSERRERVGRCAMALRSIWNGTIAFAGVFVPVKVHSATEDQTRPLPRGPRRRRRAHRAQALLLQGGQGGPLQGDRQGLRGLRGQVRPARGRRAEGRGRRGVAADRRRGSSSAPATSTR